MLACFESPCPLREDSHIRQETKKNMSEGSRPPTSKQHTLYLTCGTNLMSAYTLLQSCHCGQGPTPPVNSAASLIRCALASLQLSQVPVSSALIMAAKRPLRPDTLERICYLWNKGRCAFPGSYWFRHVCACRRKGHHARSVTKPAADSPYKSATTSFAPPKPSSDGQLP